MAKRDQLRSKVYEAEQQVRSALERAASAGALDFFGSLLPPPVERRFETLAQVRDYLDSVCSSAEFVAAFGELPVPKLRGRGGDSQAHYEFDNQTIALPMTSDWAARELVVLHELAHHVVGLRQPDAAYHGAEFSTVYCRLVELVIGGPAGLLLRAALDGEGVVVG